MLTSARVPPAAVTPNQWRGLLVATVIALALRVPTASSRAVLGFDDGTYLASVLAMRNGGAPFRDVFSSQGPVFLPLLRLADIVGAGTPWAARMVPVAAGVAVVAAVWGIARQSGRRGDDTVAAVLAATSGLLLFSTSRIGSDGVAAAFGSMAVLAATAPSRRRSVLAALLIGLAVAVKNLMAGPALLAVLWLRWRHTGPRGVVTTTVIAGATALATALPWGWREVWDQSVAMHLDARALKTSMSEQLAFVGHAVWRLDRVLVVLLVAGVGGAVVARARGRRGPGDLSDTGGALWVWVAGAAILVLLHRPLLLGHLTVLVPPAAVLAARHRPPGPVSLLLVATVLPTHVVGAGWTLAHQRLTPVEQSMVDVVSRIEPASAWVISDRQTLAWVAGRASPGDLVDPSFVRIRSGHLSTAGAVRAANHPATCAVMLWSERLASLPGFVPALPHYREAYNDGRHRLLLRDTCRLADP